MISHRSAEFDRTLKALFDDVDDLLEDRYGGRYPLHPNRPSRGSTANKESDGLFNIGASFSPGFGSSSGRGYTIDVEMVTLAHVPDEVEEEIHQVAIEAIRQRLPKFFPNRELDVERDGRIFKIVGDFRLGSL